jgi:hypothetical protein
MVTPLLIEQCGINYHVFKQDIYNGWQQEYLLAADVHWDNPHCVRRMLERHLKEAEQKQAGIFLFGDTFCAMQGAYDPRKSKNDIRPEHNVPHYFDPLVDTAGEYFAPYAHLIKMVSYGNHETAIIKRQETDLVKRLVDKLNHEYKGQVALGAYNGDIRFQFQPTSTQRLTKKLYYTHGSGGGGEVTKGVIKSARRGVYVSDSDIVIGGHIHEAWSLEIIKRRHKAGKGIELFTQHHIQTATYKEEYETGAHGWHNMQERPPKPLGSWWMKFRYIDGEIKVTFERAN